MSYAADMHLNDPAIHPDPERVAYIETYVWESDSDTGLDMYDEPIMSFEEWLVTEDVDEAVRRCL